MMELTYEYVCGIWARADHWPLEDAIRLLVRQLPRSLQQETQEEQEYKLKLELAKNCLGVTLKALDINLLDGPHVSPSAMINWADQKRVTVPKELRGAVNHAREEELTGSESKLSPSRSHRERSRGIAALLWDQQPDMTIKAMAERPELHEFGCQRVFYDHRTIKRWITPEAKSHKPGRRKKKTTV